MKKDKEKIEKLQSKRPGVYQSNGNPDHFSNEGEEYINQNGDAKGERASDMSKEVDYEKIKGEKKEE
jgi:hypothetical protein